MLKIIITRHGEKGERELAGALKARGLKLYEQPADGQLADSEQEAMDADVALLPPHEASGICLQHQNHGCDTITVITKEAAKDRDPKQELRERTLVWYGMSLNIVWITGLRAGEADDFADWLKEKHDACVKFPIRYMENGTFDEALERCEAQHGPVNEYPYIIAFHDGERDSQDRFRAEDGKAETLKEMWLQYCAALDIAPDAVQFISPAMSNVDSLDEKPFCEVLGIAEENNRCRIVGGRWCVGFQADGSLAELELPLEDDENGLDLAASWMAFCEIHHFDRDKVLYIEPYSTFGQTPEE